MALQRVRSLATTKFTDETVANAYVPAAGEMISIFVHGTYRGLRIGDGTTVGGLSLVNSGGELYEYIGEAPPEEEVVLPTPDTTPVVDTGTQTWAQQQAEQLGEATVASELFDATFYGMNSLMFDGSSHLYKDYSAEGNRQTHTLSMWIKKSENIDSSHRYFFDVTQDSANYAQIYFYDNQLVTPDYTAGNDGNLHTNNKFRDTSGWYHIVFVNDLTSDTNTLTGSSSDRVRLYVNGVQQNSFLSFSVPGQNTTSFINSTNRHILGKDSNNANAGKEFRGRMANIQFIDGMALDASYFGQYMGANWAPKSYEGAYGANGFWLDFSKTQWDSVDENTGEPTAASILQTVEDVSGNGNHWQAA